MTSTVNMLLLHGGTPRDLEAREQLAAALPGATVGEPDDVGTFDVTVESDDQETALDQVWNAVAASGVDDTSPSTGATAQACLRRSRVVG